MKCVICGNNIKEGLQECPICGSKQLTNPIYNTQQYDELQTQIQQTQAIDVEQINKRLQEQQFQYQQTIPQQYQAPIQQNYYQPVNGQYQQSTFIPQQPQMMVKQKKSSKDIVSLISGIIGIYYLFNLIIVINGGINTFISENFSSPEYAEIVSKPLTLSLCMTWPLFLAPIFGLTFGFMGRKDSINKLNTFGIISGFVILAAGFVSTFYIYNYLS